MSDARFVRPSWRGRTNVDALTIACIERAESWAGHQFVVTQGSYQPSGGGDPKSAGTHDGGGVVDLRWCGHDTCVGHLRRAGLAAWHRVPPSFDHHVHAVVVGHPLLAASAARQVDAYMAGRNGLANNGPDDGPRFTPTPLPVWPWPEPAPKPKPKPPIRRTLRKVTTAIQQAKADGYTGFADSLRKSRERARKNHAR